MKRRLSLVFHEDATEARKEEEMTDKEGKRRDFPGLPHLVRILIVRTRDTHRDIQTKIGRRIGG